MMTGDTQERGSINTRTPENVRVWDLAVRVFHWSLVMTFLAAYLSAEASPRLHEYSGYAVLGLIGFRIVWGVIGTRHARFSDFVRSPSAVWRYVKALAAGRAERHLGHNPAGGAMIVALLIMLAIIGYSGHLMLTERYFGLKWLEEVHETAVDITLILIALHVVGVLVSSLVHRENLIKSMLTGLKRSATGPSGD